MKTVLIHLLCLIAISTYGQLTKNVKSLTSNLWIVENLHIGENFSFGDTIDLIPASDIKDVYHIDNINDDCWLFSLIPDYLEPPGQFIQIYQCNTFSNLTDSSEIDKIIVNNGKTFYLIDYTTRGEIQWNNNKKILEINYSGNRYSYRIVRKRTNKMRLIKVHYKE
ncbi:MAG: hypothetical protein H6600_07030 [Flavobacteriales bacterium]|nr:hypothetical protein [Flavobacteriales bacterium]